VAGVTSQCGVRSHQRHTVVVLLNLLHGDLPSFDCVTLFAIGAQLAPMNVSVTVSTSLANVGKHRLDVALRTRYRLMHPPEGIPRLAMIEFRYVANWFPSTQRVAILAGNIQWAVWAAGVGIDLGLRIPLDPQGKQEQCDEMNCPLQSQRGPPESESAADT
jgi:hypothetical protein